MCAHSHQKRERVNMHFLSSAIMLIVGLYLTLITAPTLAAGSICGSSEAHSAYWYADGQWLNPSAIVTSPVPFDHATYIVSLGDMEYGGEYTGCSSCIPAAAPEAQ